MGSADFGCFTIAIIEVTEHTQISTKLPPLLLFRHKKRVSGVDFLLSSSLEGYSVAERCHVGKFVLVFFVHSFTV